MASSSQPGATRSRWTGAIGIALSIGLLAWVLRGVHFDELIEHVRAARPLPLLAAVFMATFMFPLRTVRWRFLLRRDGAMLPFVPLWHATAIGFMATNVLPFRAGELARPFAAHKLTGVRFTSAGASLAVERVMDGLTLLAMMALAIAAGGFDRATTVGPVTLGQVMNFWAVAFVVALTLGVFTVRRPNLALAATRKVSGALFPNRWSEKIVHAVGGLVEGLEGLASLRRFTIITFWSFVAWGVNGLSFWLCLVAFQIDVPFSAAFLLQTMIAFAVAAPAAPGFVGVFEFAARYTLALYGVGQSVAVAYALTYHITTFAPITILGLWSLSRAHLHLADLKAGAPSGEAPGNHV